MSIILGIDPGIKITGYGLINNINNKLIYIDNGFIKSNNALNVPTRLSFIYKEINKIINKFKPNFFVIEQTFIAKRTSAIIKLCQASGVAIIAAVNNNLPVFEYSSSRVKKILVGYGNAKKKQVELVVCKILKLFIKLQPDAADALAIAIAHCFINKNIY